MLLTEQDARTKACWEPRNASNKCLASDCAMWRWWPELEYPDHNTNKEPLEVGYCGLAGRPLTTGDLPEEGLAAPVRTQTGITSATNKRKR